MKKVTNKSVQSGVTRAATVAAVWILLFTAPLQVKAGGDPSQGGSQTWDCLFSGGGDNGIAYLTFGSDFTITGEELLAPKAATINPPPSSIGRGGDGIGRSGGGTNSTSASTTNQFLFGAGSLEGTWAFDAKSNIVGSFVLVGAPVQQDVSFTGRVTTGNSPRLTLSASFGVNHGTYNGVIAQTLTTSSLKKSIVKFPDPTTGMWQGFKYVGDEVFFEQFTLSSTGTPGIYDLAGSGPDYTTTGECLISSQGKIGFALLEQSDSTTNGLLRSTIGPFSDTATAIKATTRGVQDDGSAVKFNATMQK